MDFLNWMFKNYSYLLKESFPQSMLIFIFITELVGSFIFDKDAH